MPTAKAVGIYEKPLIGTLMNQKMNENLLEKFNEIEWLLRAALTGISIEFNKR